MNVKADVCLIVEGAYPFVTGGVSSWVHALLTNLPDLSFSIIHIGARSDVQRKLLYTLPRNVIELREVFIGDYSQRHGHIRSRRTEAAWQDFQVLHKAIATGTIPAMADLLPVLRRSGFAGLNTSDLFNSRESWNTLVKLYEEHADGQSFMDYFWTFRWIYLPIFKVFEEVLPQARVYHAVSTGFSGLLGALAKIRSGRPFLVTEHGIYTREREIEIVQSNWITRLPPGLRVTGQRLSFFQQWWCNTYRFMEKLSYECADLLLSITDANRQYQVKSGADTRKVHVIPNGINTQRLAGVREATGYTSERFLVGFVGRIVPIKDVKTFIRAIKVASQHIPNLEAFLVGPTEEDHQYFSECQRLVELLNLTDIVHFTGSADVLTYYRRLDVLVLTSLSEGQPLVILEANCAGIPVVATDVGACRELLSGAMPEDRALGESGLITPVASPDETARAILQLWRDEGRRRRMARAGQLRAQRFYRQEQLYHAYDRLYRHYCLV